MIYFTSGLGKTAFKTAELLSKTQSSISSPVRNPPNTNQQKPAVGEVIINREYVEWSNTWFDCGNQQRFDRILLIGDSVSREYRKSLAVLTGRPVDFFATSTPIVEQLFFKQLESFFEFKEYRQQKAHIQINLHGIDGVAGSKCNILLEDYKKAYERMVQIVMDCIPEVIISTYTHIVHRNNVAVIDEKVTDEIKRRNAIAVEIAGKYNLKTDDLYTAMLNFPRRDHVHFEKQGIEEMAKFVAKSMDLI